MKFNCIESNTTLSGHRALFGLLREQNDLTGRHIFIVPDRYTLSVERDICEILYPDGAFNVDVCSFTRLAQKALGRKNKNCLSKEGTVLLLNRVICENNDKLKFYRGIKSVSFSREMFASIASLRSSGITPDDIDEKINDIGGTVGEKLKDISVIYRAYDSALKAEYMDTITRVDWLKDHVGDVPLVKDSHIYVLGFNVYSEQQLNVIKRMLIFCPSVSIAFCKSSGGSNAFCYPNEQQEKLLAFCAECGIPVEKRESLQVLENPFDFLHNELFGFSQNKIVTAENGKVRVYGYDNVYGEINAVAREILYITRNNDYRYREIAVVANNDKYNTVIRKVFDRYGLTYFIDEKYAVKKCFYASYIRKIMVAAENGLDKRSVMGIVRHPYSGFCREQIQKFENYCIKYNVNFGTFTKPFEFEECLEAEEVRKTVIEKILFFSARDFVENYCEIVLSFKNNEFLIQKEIDYLENGLKEEQIYADKEKYIAVINEIKELCGEREVSISEFISMVDAVLENMTFSILPQYIDSVFVGNTSESRFSDIKVLFVVGANDGYFPTASGDKLIFGCYDTALMKLNGLSVYPSPEESNTFEQFALIDLVSKPQTLYITYARNSLDGIKLSEGNGVREIKTRLSLKEIPFYAYYGFNENQKLIYEFGTLENCYREYLSGNVSPEYSESIRKFLIEKEMIEEKTACDNGFDLTDGYDVTDSGAFKLSVSKMETYFKCPFKNYLTNVLHLKEKEEGGLRVNDKGSIIHSIFEKFFKKGANFLRNASNEQIATSIEESLEAVLERAENLRFKENPVSARELEGIADECRFALKILTNNLKASAFNPIMLEKRFGDSGEIALETSDKKFVFTGCVDRVDANGKKIVIIDYKTGSIPNGLEPVYTGEKIQLYLYLTYFLGKGYEPIGVFYMPISDGYKKNAASYAMKGQMLNSVEIFESLDNRSKSSQSPKYSSPNIDFVVENKQQGKVFYRKNTKNLIFSEDFVNVSEYVMKLCKKAIDEIAGGEIEKKPTDGACKYCPYLKICGEVSPRKKITVAVNDFETAIKGETNVQVE